MWECECGQGMGTLLYEGVKVSDLMYRHVDSNRVFCCDVAMLTDDVMKSTSQQVQIFEHLTCF